MNSHRKTLHVEKGFSSPHVLLIVLISAMVGLLVILKPSKILQMVQSISFSSIPSPQSSPQNFPTATPSSKQDDTLNLPTIKYKFYGGPDKIYNDNTISLTSIFVYKTEALPKELTFGDSKVTINKWEVLQTGKGFSVYAYIESNGKESKIGFWYTEGGIPSPSYGGVSGIVTKKWTDPPGTYHEEGINLIGIDYNLSTNDWESVQIDKYLYTETLLPLEPI